MIELSNPQTVLVCGFLSLLGIFDIEKQEV